MEAVKLVVQVDVQVAEFMGSEVLVEVGARVCSTDRKSGGVSTFSRPKVDEYSSLSSDRDQIGLTPEEVISKIMANPDVAMAFQNPRVQQAIVDCSQNPMNIVKYQDDKEVDSDAFKLPINS